MNPHNSNDRPPGPQPGGPREAVAVAMERCAGRLYQFLLRRLRKPEDSSDLLQTIFLRFWQHPRHELVEKPEAYLYQIASNVLSEFKLRQSRNPVTYDSQIAVERADQLTDAELWGDELGDKLGLERHLQRLLAQVPTKYRTALVLRTCAGLSFDEIGAHLGISHKTAKTYVSRAIAGCRMAGWQRSPGRTEP